MPVLGVDNLKKAIKFGIDLTKQIETAGADGWDWKDPILFLDDLMAIPGIITSGDEIKAEFNDLDEAEKVELLNYFTTNFDLANDKTEAVVESALALVLQVLTLLTLFKKVEGVPVEVKA